MSQGAKSSVIALMGPTASGKSAWAVEWAERNNAEIVSVDSALVYRGMDIGAAKPSAAEQACVRHHLLDICEPEDAYSVARFRADALLAIADIQARGRRPLLVGGTMLYFYALQYGLSCLPAADSSVRRHLMMRQHTEGLSALHAELCAVDPVAAQRIHMHDTQRILRALEVYILTGKPMTVLKEEYRQQVMEYDFITIVLAPERSVLHSRIQQRLERMWKQGFVEEVRALYARATLTTEHPAVRAVGYRQVWEYLEGRLSYEVMQERALVATRQLAKRQYTWLRRYWSDAHWVLNDNELSVLQNVLQ